MYTPDQYRQILNKGLQKQDILTSEEVNEQLKIPTPKEIKVYLDKFVVGQENPKKQIATLIVSHMVRNKYNQTKEKLTEKLNKSNILLIGNSGVGKTYMLKVASEFVKVPFIIEDATKLTQEGYHGDSVDTILTRLYLKCNKDIKKAQQGIVFIDEFDKLSNNDDDKSNVSTGAVQQSLLKIVEGGVLSIPATLGKQSADYVEIDTSDITFIFAGAFGGMIEDKDLKKKTGFFEVEQRDISEQDIIEYGIIPEILGRIGTYICLDNLTEDDLYKILVETEKSIIKEKQKLFELLNKKWTLGEEDYRKIITKIKGTQLGARGLLKEVENLTWEALYED